MVLKHWQKRHEQTCERVCVEHGAKYVEQDGSLKSWERKEWKHCAQNKILILRSLQSILRWWWGRISIRELTRRLKNIDTSRLFALFFQLISLSFSLSQRWCKKRSEVLNDWKSAPCLAFGLGSRQDCCHFFVFFFLRCCGAPLNNIYADWESLRASSTTAFFWWPIARRCHSPTTTAPSATTALSLSTHTLSLSFFLLSLFFCTRTRFFFFSVYVRLFFFLLFLLLLLGILIKLTSNVLSLSLNFYLSLSQRLSSLHLFAKQ